MKIGQQQSFRDFNGQKLTFKKMRLKAGNPIGPHFTKPKISVLLDNTQ